MGSGSIANEVQFAYDDFGQLVTEYQEHGGAVNTSTSLKVGYSYADGSSNTIRPTKMTYPDGRELNYDYGSSGSTDDALSRAASLIDNDGTTHLVDYSYLGAGSFTETDYPAIDVKHTLIGTAGGNDPDTGDIYRGLDRFGRVKDCYWYDYGSSTDVLRIKHGYDQAGNRLYREEADTSYLDQLYAYDDVNRLTQSQEGTLGAGKDSISSLNFAQQWSLDATGNWSGFKEDDDGDSTWDLNQTRTSNAVNEITNVTETAGPKLAHPGLQPGRQHDDHPAAGRPHPVVHRHLRRLEPPRQARGRPRHRGRVHLRRRQTPRRPQKVRFRLTEPDPVTSTTPPSGRRSKNASKPAARSPPPPTAQFTWGQRLHRRPRLPRHQLHPRLRLPGRQLERHPQLQRLESRRL